MRLVLSSSFVLMPQTVTQRADSRRKHEYVSALWSNTPAVSSPAVQHVVAASPARHRAQVKAHQGTSSSCDSERRWPTLSLLSRFYDLISMSGKGRMEELGGGARSEEEVGGERACLTFPRNRAEWELGAMSGAQKYTYSHESHQHLLNPIINNNGSGQPPYFDLRGISDPLNTPGGGKHGVSAGTQVCWNCKKMGAQQLNLSWKLVLTYISEATSHLQFTYSPHATKYNQFKAT